MSVFTRLVRAARSTPRPILLMAALACAHATSTQAPGLDPAAQSGMGTIHAGDIVRVRIWREPDLSGDFSVDETEAVVLPRLGAMTVTGESVASLRAKVVNAYEPILSHTSIEVTVLRRLQVLGAVRNPGLYPVDPTMTVEDGLALAGGVNPDGNPDRIELIRQGQKLPVQLNRRTPINDSPIRSGDQIYVPQRSWISRNPGIIVGILSVATTALVLVVHR